MAGLEPVGIRLSKLGFTLDVFDTRRENDHLSDYLWSTCTGGRAIIFFSRSQEVVVLTRGR